jgi:hypothetical protein
MSNSFNISDKPEIAANLVQILSNASALATIQITGLPDIATAILSVKNDTGPVRNDVTSIHDVLLPDIKGDTGPVRNDVTAIHDTMLPSVKTDTGAIRNDVTDIKSDAAAIRLKTDELPQNVRGVLTKGRVLTDSGTFEDVVNVTGHGKLHQVSFNPLNLADTAEVKITIDGTVLTIDHTGDAAQQMICFYCDSALDAVIFLGKQVHAITDPNRYINLDFAVSLLIQVRRSAGTTDNVRCAAIYSLDTF